MRTYSVEIKGVQPLLMHADNIDWSDQMDAWKSDVENKKKSKAGDDRSPAWRWLGSLYHDDEYLVIPSENIMRALLEGGSMIPVGKGQKTFKAQTQSGIMPRTAGWRLLVGGATVPAQPLMDLMREEDFAAHKRAVAEMGFSLFLKRAKIGQSKHVRVRPRFDEWSASGELVVTDDMITDQVLNVILAAAGRYKGLCDWRPGSKTPGVFGMFRAEIKRA